MADLFSTNNNLTVMRFEHIKLVAQTNIQARKIRIIELQEEIERCNVDIEAQKKLISDQDNNIKIQIEAEAKKKDQPAESK
jgi:hypothetical protein